MYTLYDYWESGNCYKVRLLLNQVEIAYQRI
ncbi:MAG: glutathione S-transferase, partial [Pseudoalteromonas tetraodonis]